MTTIGDYAFYQCSDLASVTIPANVKSIGYAAFSRCESLNSVTIEDTENATVIGNSAFENCTNLTKLTIGNGVKTIGQSAFSNCSSLTSVVIPESVTSIGQSAFYGCSSLTSIAIPNNVKSIETSTFQKCSSLASVSFGNRVKTIGDYAFYGCKAINTMTCYNMNTPSTGYESFNGVAGSTIVYVPADSYEDYSNHDVWGKFDVRKIGAESAETDEVQVTPTETTADITWPAVPEAVIYELVISDLNGNILCTLVFNSLGQLISIDFAAPDRNNAPDDVQTEGFKYTITGLSSNTGYQYTIIAKDADDKEIDTMTGSFKTPGTATNVEETDSTRNTLVRKIMRNGAVYILTSDGRLFDLQGVEIK